MRLILICCLASLSLAQTKNTPKTVETSDAEKAWSQQLAELKAKNPKQYAETMRLMTQFLQTTLGLFGYGTRTSGEMDETTTKALAEYQKRNGFEPTGLLNVRTQRRLAENYKDAVRTVPVLPRFHMFTDMWESHGYVSAKGTWTMTNDEIASPLQTTHITCYRESGRCLEAIAKLSEDDPDVFLRLDTEEWEIERWDEHEIVTKPNQYNCARAIRRFNRSQKQVTGIRSTIKTDGSCDATNVKELHMILVDGFTITRRFEDEIAKKRKSIILGMDSATHQ